MKNSQVLMIAFMDHTDMKKPTTHSVILRSPVSLPDDVRIPFFKVFIKKMIKDEILTRKCTAQDDGFFKLVILRSVLCDARISSVNLT